MHLPDLKRLVLDVLKPHIPSIVELSKRLSALPGVVGVNCALEEVDQETESITVTIEGTSINYDAVIETIKECGAVIHSVDSVSTGKKLIMKGAEDQD